MKILNEAEIVLIGSGLGTANFVKIAGIKIPRLLVRLIIFSLPILCCILEAVVCVKFIRYSVAACLWPFSVILTFSSIALIYGSLVIKSKEINDLFTYLENVINTSNAFALPLIDQQFEC